MVRCLVLLLVLMTSITSSAQHSSQGKYFVLRLKPHEDLKAGIVKFAEANGLKAAAIVSCAGSLEQTNLRYANQNSGTKLTGFFEIVSLTGTVSHQSQHLHVSVANSKGATIGGHLLEGCLVYTTAEIVLVELTELEFDREADSTYGYKELVVKPRKRSP